MPETLLTFGWLGLIAALWVALCVGSFLNVVIYRLPIMLNRQWQADAREFLQQPAADAPTDEPFNLAVPRFGTPFRAKALELGLAKSEDLVMDQGGADAFLPTATLDRDAMLDLKKRAVRRFYLRPSYLWRRLKSVRSWYELKSQVREGAALLRRNV